MRFLRASKTGGQVSWRVVEAVKEGRWPRYKTIWNLGRHESREAAQAAWDSKENENRSETVIQGEVDSVIWAFAELGLKMDASIEQVRAVYRRLAAANHPDRGGLPDAMAQINEAYEQAVSWLERGNEDDASVASA